MSPRVAPLASISFDCPDPNLVAAFYTGSLGLEETFALPERSFLCLSGAGPMLTSMKVDNCTPPAWPYGPQQQQMHFDLAAHDLEADAAAAEALGATLAAEQPRPQFYRVMPDPAGRPFCLTLAQLPS